MGGSGSGPMNRMEKCMRSLNNESWKNVAIVLAVMALTACGDSYKEPKTNEEWKAFCQAPDSVARIKAIKDEAKRQAAAGTCLRAPWQKFVPSKPKSW
jgi:entry exclusion lipoprotein TrbK